MTNFEQVANSLLKKYGKYGVTEKAIKDSMKDGIENYDLSLSAVYNGLRMSLATTFNEHENFTIYDVMEITGESREEVIKRIEDMRAEMEAAGENPDDYAREINESDIIYSNGTVQGTLDDVDDAISLIVDVYRDAGADNKKLIECAQSVYDQFDVPMYRRNLLKVMRKKEGEGDASTKTQ